MEIEKKPRRKRKSKKEDKPKNTMLGAIQTLSGSQSQSQFHSHSHIPRTVPMQQQQKQPMNTPSTILNENTTKPNPPHVNTTTPNPRNSLPSHIIKKPYERIALNIRICWVGKPLENTRETIPMSEWELDFFNPVTLEPTDYLLAKKQFLVFVDKNQFIYELESIIQSKYSKIFSSDIQADYIRNSNDSILDKEFTIGDVFANGDFAFVVLPSSSLPMIDGTKRPRHDSPSPTSNTNDEINPPPSKRRKSLSSTSIDKNNNSNSIVEESADSSSHKTETPKHVSEDIMIPSTLDHKKNTDIEMENHDLPNTISCNLLNNSIADELSQPDTVIPSTQPMSSTIPTQVVNSQVSVKSKSTRVAKAKANTNPLITVIDSSDQEYLEKDISHEERNATISMTNTTNEASDKSEVVQPTPRKPRKSKRITKASETTTPAINHNEEEINKSPVAAEKSEENSALTINESEKTNIKNSTEKSQAKPKRKAIPVEKTTEIPSEYIKNTSDEEENQVIPPPPNPKVRQPRKNAKANANATISEKHVELDQSNETMKSQEPLNTSAADPIVTQPEVTKKKVPAKRGRPKLATKEIPNPVTNIESVIDPTSVVPPQSEKDNLSQPGSSQESMGENQNEVNSFSVMNIDIESKKSDISQDNGNTSQQLHEQNSSDNNNDDDDNNEDLRHKIDNATRNPSPIPSQGISNPELSSPAAKPKPKSPRKKTTKKDTKNIQDLTDIESSSQISQPLSTTSKTMNLTQKKSNNLQDALLSSSDIEGSNMKSFSPEITSTSQSKSHTRLPALQSIKEMSKQFKNISFIIPPSQPIPSDSESETDSSDNSDESETESSDSDDDAKKEGKDAAPIVKVNYAGQKKKKEKSSLASIAGDVMRKSKEIAAQVPPVIISRPKPIPKPKSTAKRSVAKAVLPPPKEVPIGNPLTNSMIFSQES